MHSASLASIPGSVQHHHRAALGADFGLSLAGYPSPPNNQLTYSTCSPTSYKFLESRDNVSPSGPPLALAVLGWGRKNGRLTD